MDFGDRARYFDLSQGVAKVKIREGRMVREGGRLTEVKDRQFSKALAWTLSMEVGSLICVSPVQLRNADSPMVDTGMPSISSGISRVPDAWVSQSVIVTSSPVLSQVRSSGVAEKRFESERHNANENRFMNFGFFIVETFILDRFT